MTFLASDVFNILFMVLIASYFAVKGSLTKVEILKRHYEICWLIGLAIIQLAVITSRLKPV